ncbi:hypothetical protein C1I89_21200 [Achromobacter pulmonis]|uniref:DUF86 domain-containing protein n=1 Tax=Achromobacter pulmonis TaxID=1389932 RepID=A0A2N8KFV0_9BURK|nr:HepT-like ribonuclease domain-containing protein [Achromobacter pulmonis]PND32328.1 hypothetical protein C1I89_21200 [Achromobacter pulmonis]
MTQAQRIPDYLAHILEAIDRIHRYTSDMDEASFLANELVQDAVIRNIERFRATYPPCASRSMACRPISLPTQA